jgi:hypothetical protein
VLESPTFSTSISSAIFSTKKISARTVIFVPAKLVGGAGRGQQTDQSERAILQI